MRAVVVEVLVVVTSSLALELLSMVLPPVVAGTPLPREGVVPLPSGSSVPSSVEKKTSDTEAVVVETCVCVVSGTVAVSGRVDIAIDV